MDEIDARILRRLQEDSSLPIADLADAVGLSASACHRRVKMLETNGSVAGYAARLNPNKLGLSLDVFVKITLGAQSDATLSAFEESVLRYEDILECHLISGDSDYLLRIAARDIEDFRNIHRKCLSRLPGVARMETSFSLRKVKVWRGYPVTGA